jgi:hypothetical protein
MNLESRKPGKGSGIDEDRKNQFSEIISWIPGFQIVPAFLLS